MENSPAECVRVAVNVRPLITQELLMGCTDCITVPPGEPQVQIGSHCFTFDFVYGISGSPSNAIFEQCVAPLVDALFQGYNATVLAYGQTGSGKTYTMGTNYTGEGSSGGVIPNVMDAIFRRVEAIRDTEFLIRVSFIEIFKEEVFDLLDPNSVVKSEVVGAKVAAPARVPIQIRETVHGGITLSGVTEPEVRNKEEMAGHLSRGSLARATGSTNMNSQSSRSHAIFTITMEQKKSGTGCDDFGDDILSAKLHLVDLAGSERAKRTGADGLRLKEGIHINKGLLALGNVISALGDEKKRKEGGHVPYRDSKLTRLLQDSLGGNSKTVMIACVSPAETNAEETLNTLKYANRARNIQNKAIVNRDPTATQLQRMRSQIEQLEAELSLYRGDASAPFDEIQILKHKVSLLEASNAELQREVQSRQENCEHLSQRAFDAQVERDKLMMKIESVRSGKSWDEIDSDSNQDIGLLNTYVSKVQELEGEIVRLKSFSKFKHTGLDYSVDSDDERLCSRNVLFPPSDEFSSNLDGISEDLSDEIENEELQHSSRQEVLDRELKELDKKLEQKEAEIKRFANGDTSVIKLHYEKKVQELEHEKKALQKEIDLLKHNLAHISHASDGGTQKLKEDYLQKLTVLEAQVAELKKKQDAQAQLLRQKQKSDEAARRLNEEIQRIKNQKVHLQQKIKQESEQFRQWKASREKEVLQLKKEGRRNEYEMHKLKALNQRQKMVLQRKTEEATIATKRLKELLEARKASSGAGSSGPTFQAMMQAIEHELEVTVRVHEVRSAYDRQLEEREKMARELSRLKEELAKEKHQNISDSTTMSPGAKNSRIEALKNMLSSSSSTLVSMATQLSEAEERERGFGGRGRWNHVRTLADAKTVMNHLFNFASSSRCSMRDREVSLREKEIELKELKDKVVKLSGLVRHLEQQKAELIHQLKAQSFALKKHNERSHLHGILDDGVLSVSPDLKQSKNGVQEQIRGSATLLEDMDTSESEMETSDEEYSLPEEPSEDDWTGPVKMNSRTGRRSMAHFNNVTGNSKSESSVEGTLDENRNIGGVCCACSRSSLCKTVKCQCRATRGLCGPSCGCLPSKCSNREVMIGEKDEGAALNKVENTDNGYSSDEEKNRALASHGALLLRSAFASQTADDHDDGETKRKPLSDIGNTRAKSNAPKPNRRKQWRRQTIQLVPAPLPSTQPENAEPEVRQKSENGSASETDIPIKLPRAMQQSQSSSGNVLFRERNSDQSEEPANKDPTVLPPLRRPRPPKPTDEKENYGR